MRLKKYAHIMRLVIGTVFLFITLQEAAMSHEIGVLTADSYVNDPYTNHQCPAEGSEPVHHCPQCCVFSHSFVHESCQGTSFIIAGDCGTAAVFERTAVSNLLPDTLFHPPKGL